MFKINIKNNKKKKKKKKMFTSPFNVDAPPVLKQRQMDACRADGNEPTGGAERVGG